MFLGTKPYDLEVLYPRQGYRAYPCRKTERCDVLSSGQADKQAQDDACLHEHEKRDREGYLSVKRAMKEKYTDETIGAITVRFRVT